MKEIKTDKDIEGLLASLAQDTKPDKAVLSTTLDRLSVNEPGRVPAVTYSMRVWAYFAPAAIVAVFVVAFSFLSTPLDPVEEVFAMETEVLEAEEFLFETELLELEESLLLDVDMLLLEDLTV